MLDGLAGVLHETCGACGQPHARRDCCAPDDEERLDFVSGEAAPSWPLRESLHQVLRGRAPWRHALDVSAQAETAMGGALRAIERALPVGALAEGLETVEAAREQLRYVVDALARYRESLLREEPEAATRAADKAADALRALYRVNLSLGREISARRCDPEPLAARG